MATLTKPSVSVEQPISSKLANVLKGSGATQNTQSSQFPSPLNSSSYKEKSSARQLADNVTERLQQQAYNNPASKNVRSGLNVSTNKLSDQEKYVLATNEAENLIADKDANKSSLADMLGKSEKQIDKMNEDQLFKDTIDYIFENDYGAQTTGREIRGENTGTDIVNGIKNGIGSFNTSVGNVLDTVWDSTAGNLYQGLTGDDSLKNWFTGEDLAFLPDIAEDVALAMIPGAGLPLVVGKNLVQNSDNLYEGITGKDAITQENLDTGQRQAKIASALVNTGLSAIPAAGKVASVGKAAKEAGKAASEAENLVKDTFKSVPGFGEAEKQAAEKTLQDSQDAVKSLQENIKTAKTYLKNTKKKAEKVNSDPNATDAEKKAAEQSVSDAETMLDDAKSLSKDNLSDMKKAVRQSEKNLKKTNKTAGNDAAQDLISKSLENVDRNLPAKDEIAEILKNLESNASYVFAEGDERGLQIANAIRNAAHTADDAASLSAMNLLRRGSTRYAESEGIGQQLLSNIKDSVTHPIKGRREMMDERDKTPGGYPVNPSAEISENSPSGFRQLINALENKHPLTAEPNLSKAQQAADNFSSINVSRYLKKRNQKKKNKNGLFSKFRSAEKAEKENAAETAEQAASATESEPDIIQQILDEAAYNKDLQSLQGINQNTPARIAAAKTLGQRGAGVFAGLGTDALTSAANGQPNIFDPSSMDSDDRTRLIASTFARALAPGAKRMSMRSGYTPTGISAKTKPSLVNYAARMGSSAGAQTNYAQQGAPDAYYSNEDLYNMLNMLDQGYEKESA